MDEIKKQNIESCLECKIGHAIISDYILFYESLICGNNIEKEDKELLIKYAELLGLSGDFTDICKKLKLLYADEMQVNDNMCIARLQPIIKELILLFEKDFSSMSPVAKIMFQKMNELKANVDENHNDSEGILTIKNLHNEKYIQQNEAHIYKVLYDIYQDYATQQNMYEFEKKDACEKEYFSNIVKSAYLQIYNAKSEQSHIAFFVNRVMHLCDESQFIIREYIKNAPKKFGVILQALMKQQDMSEQKIKNFTGIEISAIQSLIKSNEPNRAKSDITLIARALLVSEDVLYGGIGLRYGNWMDLEKKETVDYFEKNQTERTFKNRKEIKPWVRKTIREILTMEHTEFQQLIEMYPDLFVKEKYEVFPNLEDAYDALLNKKEANTLLEILEKWKH